MAGARRSSSVLFFFFFVGAASWVSTCEMADVTMCKVTPVMLHGVVSPERATVTTCSRKHPVAMQGAPCYRASLKVTHFQSGK